MNDSAITHDLSGNMTVDTYSMDGASVGMNDFGQALYDFGGVTMTAEQAEENAHFFETDEDDGYGNSSYDQDDTLPNAMLEGLNRINEVLGGGAADWIADELLGIGDSRMSEVLQATNMEHGEIQSYANAVVIDLAANVGMDHEMLMTELGNDINRIREMGSDRGMNEMHEIISDAVAGNYHASMQRWDRLRGALRSIS